MPLNFSIRDNFTQLTFADFPIGTRVKVVSKCVDFHFFNGETGTVIRNSGKYLGIIVLFDSRRLIKNFNGTQTWEQKEFGFNPQNLQPLPQPSDEYAYT